MMTRVKKMMVKVLLVVLFVGAFSVASYYDTHTVKECTVVNTEKDIVTVVDEAGHEWQYQGVAKVGETAKITFYNNHTTGTIADDEITKVKMTKVFE